MTTSGRSAVADPYLEQLRAELIEAARPWVKDSLTARQWLNNLVAMLTEDWQVEKQRVRGGPERFYTITTPWRPPTVLEVERDREREDRAEWHRRGDDDVPPPPSMSMLEILDQRVWWITSDKQVMRVDDMTPEHRVHLLAHLKRRAPSLQLQEWSSGLFNDAPDDVAEQAAEEDPMEWLGRQEFVRRLRKLIRKDNRAKGQQR